MSTNYYARTPDTPANEDGLHIGQSAAGWEFLWQAHRDPQIKSVEDWREYLFQPDVRVVDEYGEEEDDLDGFLAWAIRSNAATVYKRTGEGVDFRDEHDRPFSYADFC